MTCVVERVLGGWVGDGGDHPTLDLEASRSSSSSGGEGGSTSEQCEAGSPSSISGGSGGGSGIDNADKEAFRPWDEGSRHDTQEEPPLSPQQLVLSEHPSLPANSVSPPPPPSSLSSRLGGGGRGQRNYKNMTRERRMEANARERSRVHTISAAFETLRKSVPAYSHNQKLSKLSVLRVAASYILTLSRVLGEDYSADKSSPSLAQCIENVTNTIQMEGKLRKRKDDQREQ